MLTLRQRPCPAKAGHVAGANRWVQVRRKKYKMKTSIQKGKEGEEYVNDLAYKSFLKYWCYPNPMDEDGDKKEICDLLILFKNICIIVSVKNYKDSGVDRYFKKTIKKSINQISGAERKLFHIDRSIYIKHPERVKEKFQNEKFTKIYRLIINVGEPVEMQILDTKTKKGDFISVLDKDIFEVAMKHLDTILDFINYLEKREAILNHMNEGMLLCKERDLLAFYLENGGEFPAEILESDADLIIIDLENKWEEFQDEFKVRLEKKEEEEKASRTFDSYIESNFLNIPNGPEVAKEFLSLNRFQRRLMSNALLEFIEMNKDKGDRAVAQRYFAIDNFGISFLFHGKEVSHDNFVEIALQALMIKSSQLRNYKEEHLLGLSINNQGSIYKIKYINPIEITQEIEDYTESVVKDLGWFKNMKKKSFKVQEFPEKE